MKLSAPMTWEVLLSQRGNTSSAWEYLIETKKVSFNSFFFSKKKKKIMKI